MLRIFTASIFVFACLASVFIVPVCGEQDGLLDGDVVGSMAAGAAVGAATGGTAGYISERQGKKQ
jgi:hypothetical protein